MRDFLHSETASSYGLANIPDDPALTIETASQLDQGILEPSPKVNRTGNQQKHSCASNEANYAGVYSTIGNPMDRWR